MEIASIYLDTDGQIKFKIDGKNIRFVLETKLDVIRVLEASSNHIAKNVVVEGHPEGKDLIVY
jgi:hypothetical protein